MAQLFQPTYQQYLSETILGQQSPPRHILGIYWNFLSLVLQVVLIKPKEDKLSIAIKEANVKLYGKLDFNIFKILILEILKTALSEDLPFSVIHIISMLW